MQDYKKLVVWAKAHQLVLCVYRVTGRWSRRADAGLAAQLRRAAASIAANIVEGCHRRTRTDFARFLDIAYASAAEVEYHLLLARDIELLGEEQFVELDGKTTHVKRMLAGLQKRLKTASTDDS
jgi:four helix bundle protein